MILVFLLTFIHINDTLRLLTKRRTNEPRTSPPNNHHHLHSGLIINKCMLLIELVKLQTESLAGEGGLAMIHPASNKFIDAPDEYEYHLQMFADNPTIYGIRQDDIESSIESTGGDVLNWAHYHDGVDSYFHLQSYNKGWVRWRQYPKMILMSGRANHVHDAMSLRAVAGEVKEQVEERSDLVMELMVLNQSGRSKFLRRDITNMREYNELKRQVQEHA